MIREQINPLERYNDAELLERYRFNAEMIQNIVNEVELPNEGNTRGRPVPKINKICGAVRFCASGSFQRLVGDLGGISHSATSRILTEVTNGLCTLADRYIQMPDDDELPYIMNGFYRIAGLPGIIGGRYTRSDSGTNSC